jgi:hypothetical protein
MWKSAGRAPSLRVFCPGICLTTEGKARKNRSQGKRNFSQVTKNLSQSAVYILQRHPRITKPTQTNTHYKTDTNTRTFQNRHKRTHYKTHTYAHPHTLTPTITKQYKKNHHSTIQNKPNTRSTQMNTGVNILK